MDAQVRGERVGGARGHAGGASERARAVVRPARGHRAVLPRHVRARAEALRFPLLLATVSLDASFGL